MRLSLIFLAVLAASVTLTSLAAWGITYGVSYTRVTTMASEFTQLELGVLQLFDSFVSGLLRGNADLVDNVLALERQSGDTRMQQTKSQVLRIIGNLVNYTTNATDQSQQQMNAVVDTFSGLMGAVFTDFKGVTITCAANLRSQLATKVSTFVIDWLSTRTTMFQRFQSLSNLGLLGLSQAATDPITTGDCTLLGWVCSSALETGIWGILSLVSAGGRFYYCVPGKGAFLSYVAVNGSQYTEYHQTWLPSSNLSYKQQCQSIRPVSVVVGQGCALPQSCQCGADERCSVWYRPYLTDSTQRLMGSDVFIGKFGGPQITISYPLLNGSAAPAALLGAVGTDFVFSGAQLWLSTVANVPAGTFVALLLNDTALSQIASVAQKCAANEPVPGDQSLPTWSALRSCDPYVREMAAWLYQNRSTVLAQRTVTLSGVVWDIFPNTQVSVTYFCIIGAKEQDTYHDIDTSAAKATDELTTVRTQQLSQVAASGAATQTYMTGVQADNIQEVQATQTNFSAQMDAMEATSKAELAASQRSSTTEVEQLMGTQAKEVDALKAKHLDAMTTATGWILGVVFAILVVVLLLSAWGTVRVTRDLRDIIGLMEDVADMKVENLELPARSGVKEVARIQTAFQVLVIRLAEYKSYMPASLFQRTSTEEFQIAEDGHQSDSPTDLDLSCTTSRTPTTGPGMLIPLRSDQPGSSATMPLHQHTESNHESPSASDTVPRRSPCRKSWKRNVAVLTVNVTRFHEVLPNMNDGAVRGAFSQYIAIIHEAAVKDRGNVDCILGDQVFVTFNAHIPCSDPAGAAALAALNVQSRLLQQVVERLSFQVGVSFGQVHAGVVGYTKFKSMVTMGTPMKVASVLSHITNFDNGTIITDAHTEERLRYNFNLRPAEVVRFPQPPASTRPAASSHIFLLQSRKQLKEQDEWMYQLDRTPVTEWCSTFNLLNLAQTTEEMHSVLFRYLSAHPKDPVALRLRSRLPMWVPGVGIPL
eukprot:EG_transcript_738